MESFIEYMWYLLTAPFKKVKKSLNKWYVLCKVWGKRFDIAKEAILRARDEGLVATCSHEMLPLHAADRGLTRYSGEQAENFRTRIAMYEEVCKLGGLNEGILLAVRTLGYTNPQIERAATFRKAPDRWAEFYIIIVMDVDEEHPISFDILKKTVRRWKEVEAKDNYYMEYKTSLREPHDGLLQGVHYKKFLYFFNYMKLDGKWQMDGSQLLNSIINQYSVFAGFCCILGCIHKTGISGAAYRYMHRVVEKTIIRGDCQIIIEQLLKGILMTEAYFLKTSQSQKIGNVTWHEEHNFFLLDGSWKLDGSKILDAYQKTEVL